MNAQDTRTRNRYPAALWLLLGVLLWKIPQSQWIISAIHEAAHALAAWVTGGTVTSIQLVGDAQTHFRSRHPGWVWWVGYPTPLFLGAGLSRWWPAAEILLWWGTLDVLSDWGQGDAADLAALIGGTPDHWSLGWLGIGLSLIVACRYTAPPLSGEGST